MNILYIITILTIYILFMLIHKTEKKQNAITWLAISAILILCYNTLICVIYSCINILCTLQNLTICNTIMAIILSVALLKSKKIQKYYVKISDIIVSILFLIIVIIVAYMRYGFPFNIQYEVTDGSTHYFFAEQFYENSTLLYNKQTHDLLGIYKADFRLPGAYVNEGILFKVFDSVLLRVELFILFDLFILYLSGILFYCLLQKYTKNNKMQIIATIFSIIYMLGYQLNSMLYGYVYLSLALSIIIAFLILMASNEKDEIKSTVTLPVLSLISVGMFFSYAYFIPIIYIAIITDIVLKCATNKEKIVSSKNIAAIIYFILIPLTLGIFYFIILPLVSGLQTEISTIGTAGEIYKNKITNYLPFIPIFIISIILGIKNKHKGNNLPTILFTLSTIFTVILWIGNKFEIVSEYYFFKAYYIIWLLTIYNVFINVCQIGSSEKRILKIVTYIYIGIYVLVIIAVTLILKKNIGINNIFYHNLNSIESQTYILKNEELKIAEMAKNSIESSEIYIYPPKNMGRMQWVSVLINNQRVYIDFLTNNSITIEDWLYEKGEKYYFAYYKDLETSEKHLDGNSNQYKIIYNDEYAFILERVE